MTPHRLRQSYWRTVERLAAFRFRALLRALATRNLFARNQLLDSAGPIVSLTSFGARVGTVFLTIESISRGSVLPQRLILWLADAEMVNRPPRSLRSLMRRGLEIKLCENLGPHAKYFPFVESTDRFCAPLVTADDDVIYPVDWLAGLVGAYRANPSVISCYRARVVQAADGRLLPYASWPLCETSSPSLAHFATGVSGVIYPTEFLAHLKGAGRAFVDACPSADDLWLHVNAVRAGLPVRQIRDRSVELPSIPNTQKVALFRFNQLGNRNDAQIGSTYRDEDISKIDGAIRDNEKRAR